MSENETQLDGEMSVYKDSALSVVSFKTVYDKKDLGEDGYSFKPKMAHQIFGDSESIFGYRSLSILLYYLHNSCKCYVKVKAGGAIDDDNLKPDDIMEKLEPWLPEGFCIESEKMLKFVEHEKHDAMYGKVIDEFKDNTELNHFKGRGVFAKYKITKVDATNEEFQKMHSRFETYIFWYIDAANSIDLTDGRWLLYYVYEEFEHPDHSGEIFRSPVGYCSIYKFFSYPDKIRARISQFFVLPSHQRRGIGSRLYGAAVKDLREENDIVDITVEEPTETFQKIRDVADCLTVHKKLKSEGVDYNSNVRKVYDAMKNLKICSRQQKRLYDLLSGSYAKQQGTVEYRKFAKKLRDEIATEIEKEGRLGKRFKEMEKTMIINRTERKIDIESKYKKYLEDVEDSINRFWERLHVSV